MIIANVIKYFSFAFILLFIVNIGLAQTATKASIKPVLRMVYKESGKSPYIEKAPDNSGLYKDLLSEALTRIGYRLEIVRVPKSRAYLLLERGEVELYPALLFNDKRGEFLTFIPNGLFRDEEYVGLTSSAIPKLVNISDITKYGLSWIYDRGSSTQDEAIKVGVEHYAVSNLNLSRAIDLAHADRPVFYKVVDEDLSSYLENNNLINLDNFKVRLHEGLFKPVSSQLYVGFSKASSLYKEEVNPAFNKNKPISFLNTPVRQVSGSVPDKLAKAFKKMVEDGTVAAIKKKYGL